MTRDLENSTASAMRNAGANYLRDHLLDPSQGEAIAERAYSLMFNIMLQKTKTHERQ